MSAEWPDVTFGAVPHPTAADDLAARIRGEAAGRLDIGRICSLGGVEVRVSHLRGRAIRHEAMLMPRKERGFLILLDPDVTQRAGCNRVGRQRVRFRLAHELGHTFFYERGGGQARRALSPSRAEERFCSRFASMLLVSRRAAALMDATPASLRWTASVHDVSLQAAAWAAVYAQPGLEVIFLRTSEHPRTGGAPAMRVGWAATESFVARGESLKSALAGLERGEHHGVESLKLAGRPRRAWVDAFSWGGCMLLFLRPLGPSASSRLPTASGAPASPSTETGAPAAGRQLALAVG